MQLATSWQKNIAKLAPGRRLAARLYGMWRKTWEYSPSFELDSHLGRSEFDQPAVRSCLSILTGATMSRTGATNLPPKLQLLLADIYTNASKPREAIAELERFAKLDPNSAYYGPRS